LLIFQIPVVANALGGILVGLVTSYAGGVRKVGSVKVDIKKKTNKTIRKFKKLK
jgi:hypothetical protein